MHRVPKISVIVPLQEHLSFGDLLHALALQQDIEHEHYEIIAVDSLYLSDWPSIIAEFRRSYPELCVRFEQIDRTKSRAKQLNIGIKLARADLLLLLADDFIPSKQLVSTHLYAHDVDSRNSLVAIGPGLFPANKKTNVFMKWLEKSGELFGVRFSDPGLVLPPNYFYMANTSIKKSFLAEAGNFNENFPYDCMDDWEMGLRLSALGMQNKYLPDAVAIHEHVIDLQERSRAMVQAGESSAIFDAESDLPGPWAGLLMTPKTPYSKRKHETLEQRYRRVLHEHWLSGYRSYKH